MRYSGFFATTFLMLAAVPSFADEARALFDRYCIACHKIKGPPQIAPPIFGVINHVKEAYPQRDVFVERIVKWVENPNPNDTLMQGAVRRFGVMPKLGYPSEGVRKIGELLYDYRMDLPAWDVEHYRQEHGRVPMQQ